MSTGCFENFGELYRAAEAETDPRKRHALLDEADNAARAWEETLLGWLTPEELAAVRSQVKALTKAA